MLSNKEKEILTKFLGECPHTEKRQLFPSHGADDYYNSVCELCVATGTSIRYIDFDSWQTVGELLDRLPDTITIGKSFAGCVACIEGEELGQIGTSKQEAICKAIANTLR